MNKIWLLSGAAVLSLVSGIASAADDGLPAYGDLYNVEWCPCNPEEAFDADGSVVMGRTVMCPCDGLYSGYKKGFDEDVRDIKNAVKHQVRKLNYFKYYVGLDYNLGSPSAGDGKMTFDDIRFAASPITLKGEDVFDDQDSLSFVLGARINKNFGFEAFYQQTYKDNTTSQIDNNTLNAGGNAYYLMNEYTTSYRAYGLDFIGYVPLSPYFDLLASVGVAKYEFENEANFAVYRFSSSTTLDTVITQKYTDDNVGWRIAAGGQLNIAEGVALRAMYRYAKIGGDVIDDMSEVSLGVRFLF